jgi:methylase of polypeptide subunit release factors
MASISEPSIDELNRQSVRLEAEARILRAEAEKARAARELEEARRSPFAIDRSMWWFMLQAAFAALVLMSIGFAIVAVGSARG